MLGVVFYSVNFRRFSTKFFLYPIEGIDCLSSNLKRYFTSDYFLLSSGGLKIAKLAMFWSKLCAL